MATLAHVEFDATDESGNLLGDVDARVELEGGGLVSIYSDRAGSTPLANPETFADGKINFYVAGGALKITLTSGAFSRVLRYKANGLLAEKDSLAAAAVAFTPAAGLLSTNVQAAIEEVAAASGSIGGSTGATDNRLLRADGTGGSTLQSSGVTLDDSDYLSGVARLTFDKAPAFDLASSVLAVAMLIPLAASTLAVAASKQFNAIRFSQPSGADLVATVGSAGAAVGVYSSITAGSGSDATSNVYGAVAHATNAGPGTTRGLHAGGYGSGSSTGPLNAVAGEINPVSTQGYTSAFFAALNSTGVHDKAIAYAAESGNGDRYLVAFGNGLAALPINVAYFRAWMATGSSANARAFQLLDNGGSEIAYWSKAGDVVAPNLIASSATNGITISQAAVTRNNAAGSMTFAAGTNAGNTFAIQTGGSTRFDISDTASRAAGFLHSAFNTAPPAGGSTSVGIKLSSTSNLGWYVGTGAPTLSAGKGSLYCRTDATTTTTRLYINTDGGTTWANFTASA